MSLLDGDQLGIGRCMQALFRGEDSTEATAGGVLLGRFLKMWTQQSRRG